MSYNNLIYKAMKQLITFCLLIIAFYSCAKGPGENTIHLSTRTAEFNASGDSIIVKTGGNWWWVSDISVDTTWYYGFTGVDLQADSYKIKQDCFDVEHRDKNTLFIKVTANPNYSKRIVTVGLEAGDYFDKVTITQKSK